MTYHVTHLEKANTLPSDPTWETLHTFTSHQALLQAVIQFSSPLVRVSFVFNGVETIQLDLTEIEADYALSSSTAGVSQDIFTRCYTNPCRWLFKVPDPRGWAGGAGNLVIQAQGYGAGPAKSVTRGMVYWRVL